MKPRTTVVLLEPATSVDPYSTVQEPDWTQDPTAHPSPAAVEPVSSADALREQTISSRWMCYLPAGTVIAAFWRIRWDGEDYDIEGDIERWQGAHGEAYRSCVLTRTKGGL